eukprot:scaffold209385_cov73-Attheya_sp.AAC.4
MPAVRQINFKWPQAAYLSKRKMHKIKLASQQSSCIQITPPKLDLYGMGYKPFANAAPEY